MTDDYVSLYVHSATALNDPTTFLSLLFLFLGRMLPIISLSPFFGARVLPHPVKLTFAISLFIIFIPQLIANTKAPLFYDEKLVMLLIKEIFIGLLMGFLVSVPFIVVQNVGMLIDHQRGGASLMVNDPTIQNQSSPIGTLFNFVLIYIFFLIDGPFQVIDAVSLSYDIIPPDQFLNPRFFSLDTPFYKLLVELFNKVMVISVQLAAPALIAILMTDVFLGIANRLAPQVQITFLGLPLKSLLGLAVIFFGWQLFTEQLVTESYLWLKTVSETVTQLQPIKP
jgi:type III secretion protein SpaR/YscT/HrcT